MSLPLTPEALAAAYDFLRACPPIRTWKLPDSDSVEFHVTRHHGQEGDCILHNGKLSIRVSTTTISHTDSLLQVMGHEMVHMFQFVNKLDTPNTKHNSRFRSLARAVCRVHGWDYKVFVR